MKLDENWSVLHETLDRLNSLVERAPLSNGHPYPPNFTPLMTFNTNTNSAAFASDYSDQSLPHSSTGHHPGMPPPANGMLHPAYNRDRMHSSSSGMTNEMLPNPHIYSYEASQPPPSGMSSMPLTHETLHPPNGRDDIRISLPYSIISEADGGEPTNRDYYQPSPIASIGAVREY